MVGAAFLAPLIAPHDPYDLKSLSLLDANTPPAWEKGGDRRFLLGTDDQGRDILSTILYGTRSSMLIGICSVLLAVGIGAVARPVGRLCRRPHRQRDHAHRRCAADRSRPSSPRC